MQRKTALYILITIIFLVPPVTAQQYRLRELSDDQFLEWLAAFRSGRAVPPLWNEIGASRPSCGLHVTGEILRRKNSFDGEQRRKLSMILSPPLTDSTVTSPSGRFVIHFSLDGPNEPALLDKDGVRIPGTATAFALEAASAFDRAWEMQIDSLGYVPPPFQRGKTAYHVFITAQSPGYYGSTFPDENLPPIGVAPRTTSFIEIDNDFLGLYSKGLAGLQVTAAHEFHHAIQLGSYGWWSYDTEGYFYELTSTYFEDVVFPDVNDYYYYLSSVGSIFRSPSRSILSRLDGDGYDLAVWGKMLEQRYTGTMLRATWEEIRNHPPLQASDLAFRSGNSDLAAEFCTFARWNYFTSYRSASGRTYSEAGEYPLSAIRQSVELLNGGAHCADSLPPISTHYVRVYKGADTVTFIVSNSDVSSAFNRNMVYSGYAIEVTQAGGTEGFTPLSNGWGYKFLPRVQDVMCVTAVVGSNENPLAALKVYPNPFNPSADPPITISLPGIVSRSKGELQIFNSALERVYQDPDAELRREGGEVKVRWDGKTGDGTILPSGIYFFSVAVGGEIHVGKFAILVGNN